MLKEEKLNGHNYSIQVFKVHPLFQCDRAWYVVKDDPPSIPIADYIQQHGPDELGHAPTPADIRISQAKAMSIFPRIVEDTILGRFLHIDSAAIL